MIERVNIFWKENEFFWSKQIHSRSLCWIYKYFSWYCKIVYTFKNSTSKTVPDDKPWYEIRHFSIERDRFKKKLIKSDGNYLKEQYKKLRNKVNNFTKKKKKKKKKTPKENFITT